MEKFHTEIKPHPAYLDVLFAHKRKVNRVFGDVLGLYEINHISVSYVTNASTLISLSSTPAIEFNLFNAGLWQYDQTFSTQWYKQCLCSSWQSLYAKVRYDELYYIKQLKHQLPLGLSLATQFQEGYLIYALATQSNDAQVTHDFEREQDTFYKIGQYCTNLLLPLFHLIHEETEQPFIATGTV